MINSKIKSHQRAISNGGGLLTITSSPSLCLYSSWI